MPQIPPPEPLYEHRPGVWIKPTWLRFYAATLQTRMFVLKVQDALLVDAFAFNIDRARKRSKFARNAYGFLARVG